MFQTGHFGNSCTAKGKADAKKVVPFCVIVLSYKKLECWKKVSLAVIKRGKRKEKWWMRKQTQYLEQAARKRVTRVGGTVVQGAERSGQYR
jgi:hypothetical protein